MRATRALPLLFAIINCISFTAFAATVSWKSAVSGNWNDGTKWSSGAPPGAGDDVVIDSSGNYTVTLNAAANLNTLKVGGTSGTQTFTITAALTLSGAGTINTNAVCQIDGGSLEGVGDLMVEKEWIWTSGTLSGTGRIIIATGATAEFADGGGKTWGTRVVVNQGTLKWTSAQQVTIHAGARLENSGTVDLQGRPYVIYGGGAVPVCINNGTLVRSTGTQEGFWDFLMLNGGTVAVNTGKLNFRRGGSASASWAAGAGAQLTFASGSFTNHPSSSFAGPGAFVVEGGEFVAAVDQTIAPAFEQRGGDITGPANLALPNWLFAAGSLAGDGKIIIPPGNTAEVADGGGKTWGTRTVVNQGTLKWTSAQQVTIHAGARLENAGTVDLQGRPYVIYGGGAVPVCINNGTLVRSTGTQEGFWDFLMLNGGTVAVNTGKLNFRRGGSASASWAAGAGAQLTFASGSFTNHPSSSFAGPGAFVVEGGEFVAAVDQTIAPAFEQRGGDISGPATLTLPNWLFAAGSLAGDGKIIIPPGNTAEFADGGGKTWGTRVVVNQGTLKWTTAQQVTIHTSARLENSGTVDLQGRPYVIYGGGAVPVFINNGTLVRSAGTQDGYWDFLMLNGGTVAVNTGKLNFRQGGSAAANWVSGAGAQLTFASGSFTNHPGTSFTGAGAFVVEGGQFVAAVDQAISPAFEQRGGDITGPATLTLPNWIFAAGSLAGDGKIIIPPGNTAEFADGGGKTWGTRVVVNQGTLKWTTAQQVTIHTSARLENSGTVDLQGRPYVIYGGGAQPTFVNSGSLLRSAGNQDAYWDFQVENSGTIRLITGTLAFRGGFTQTAGAFELQGGQADGPSEFNIGGGTLSGAGSIASVVNLNAAGLPGNPLGRLTVGGNFTSGASTKLTFQLGGTQGGTNYDQIISAGSVQANGELKIELANGFEPSGADAFILLGGKSRTGTFTATNAPPGFSPEVTYTTTNVTLRLIKTGIVGPQITQQPQSKTVTDGQPVTFSVTATGAGLTYQWRKEGANIAGATAASFEIDAAKFSDAGKYSVLVANAGGSTTSDDATLTVNPGSLDSGLLARYPFDGDLNDAIGGQNGTGNGSLAYTNGARNASLRFDGASWLTLGADPAQPIVNGDGPFSATFWIRPRLLQGMVPLRLATSAGEFAVYLTTGPGSGLATHFGFRGFNSPASTDARAAIENYLGCWTHVTLVYKGGDRNGGQNFELYINGELIPLNALQPMSNATNLNEIGRNIAGFGSYVFGDMDEVRVYGRALRAEDAVALAADAPPCPPEVTQQPSDATPLIGASFQLAAGVIGKAPLNYQWFKNDTAIPNATANPFVVAAASHADSGTYHLRVSNQFGETASSNAVVSVQAPPPPGLTTLNTGTTSDITSSSFLNGSYGGYVTRGGGAYFTGNGGVSWTPSSTGFTVDLSALQLIGSVAYLSGGNGLVAISTNSGAIWTPFDLGTSESFHGLSFANPTYGYSVGSRGTIYCYNGRTWTALSSGTVADLYAAAFGGETPWVAGAQGTILRYLNGIWESVLNGVNGTFYGLAFRNADYGLAVGSGGIIYRWNGTSWTAVNSGVTAHLRNVVIADDNTAYAAGDAGLLLISRNAGLDWAPLSTGSTADFLGLAASGGKAFVFGDGGAGYSFPVPNQVINLPPLVRITEPHTNDQFYACLEIFVTAQVSDPDGSIAKVEFYRGQFKLAEITKAPRPGSPYRTSFRTDVFGEYELRAVATDNLGAVTVSDPVTIEVIPPPFNTAVAESFTADGMAICFLGAVGSNYVLQAANDLHVDVPNEWVNISTNQMPELLMRVVDPSATNFVYRFYRFLLKP